MRHPSAGRKSLLQLGDAQIHRVVLTRCRSESELILCIEVAHPGDFYELDAIAVRDATRVRCSGSRCCIIARTCFSRASMSPRDSAPPPMRSIWMIRFQLADCTRKMFLLDRLQKVIDRIHFEGVERISIIGCREDHQRMPRAELLQQFKAGHAGHFDIQEQDVGKREKQIFECAARVAICAHDFDPSISFEESPQPGHRQRFIVYQVRFHRARSGWNTEPDTSSHRFNYEAAPLRPRDTSRTVIRPGSRKNSSPARFHTPRAAGLADCPVRGRLGSNWIEAGPLSVTNTTTSPLMGAAGS